MKRKWVHPEEPESSRVHWRSLGELENSKEFQTWLEREFPQGAAEMNADETTRRSFVKLMGASTALAGFGVSCSRPVRNLVPYNEHVEWIIPGKALYYSTAKPALGGIGCDPLVVTTHEGRPTKVDGNRLHPAVGGGSSAWTQASILELYDQDRSKSYLKKNEPTIRGEFEEGFLKPFREAKSGNGVAFLLSPSTSPTRNALIADVAKAYPGAKFYSYEALQPVGQKKASEALCGEGAFPVVSLAKVKRLLALDSDFLGYDPVGENSNKEFSETRLVDERGPEMSRLYVAEPAFTLTGGLADHRYRVAASQILSVAALVAKEVATLVGDAALGNLADSIASRLVLPVYHGDWIREAAADLVSKKDEALVVLGSRQSREAHLIVAAINQALGAYGKHIQVYQHAMPKLGDIAELAAEIKSEKVETLFLLNEGDLVFDAPADLDFPKLLAGVKTVVHHNYNANLTSEVAQWHVPATHYLESWGDHRSVSGIYSVQQPAINPLWGGTSENVLLLSLLQEEANEEAVLARVKLAFAAAGGKDWTATLRDGYAEGTTLPAKGITADLASFNADLARTTLADFPHREGLEVLLTTSGATYDGRFANNSWLQEAPDPITKLTWDNAGLLSLWTAEQLGLEDGDLIEVSKGSRKVVFPVLTAPGHADFAISLPVGYYGDQGKGRVSVGAGFNAYPLKTTAESYVVTGAAFRKINRKHILALTAEHYSMEGRAIAREGTVEMFEKDKAFAQTQGMDSHIPENISFYQGPDYAGGTFEPNRTVTQIPGHEYKPDVNHQWAMTVDLNSCTGCNACVISCQAENNIPVVGKSQVLMGREMHWLRMDRYFTSPKDAEPVFKRGGVMEYIKDVGEKQLDVPGRRRVDDDNIEMIPTPIGCLQCESAPCESVCPVNATTHTPDGLNAMTYNRCIGTRYCANNCPYKARRFNYYDYNKRPVDKMKNVFGSGQIEGIKLGPLAPANGFATTTQQLQKNPNVTVRMRGVIEKCTYCVQRITAAKIAAKAAARDSDEIMVKTHSLTTACQDACGFDAIMFGNLKDPKDRINGVKGKENPRNYDLLKYIGTRPRTSYLARVKNPNPKMPGAEYVGTVTSKMH